MIAVVWQVEIHEGKSGEFEQLYGANGEWTKLSRRSRSFLGSSFLRDLASETRYMLVEYLERDGRLRETPLGIRSASEDARRETTASRRARVSARGVFGSGRTGTLRAYLVATLLTATAPPFTAALAHRDAIGYAAGSQGGETWSERRPVISIRSC